MNYKSTDVPTKLVKINNKFRLLLFEQNSYIKSLHTHTHTHTPHVDSGDECEPRAVLGEWLNEVASGQLCGSDTTGMEVGTRVGHRH